MRKIDVNIIADKIKQLLLTSNTDLPQDLLILLKAAEQREESRLAKFMLEQIVSNAAIAKENQWPMCQDTGMAVIFVDIGQEVHLINGDINQAINAKVAEAYREGNFRNSVASPLERVNTANNTPAIIHYQIIEGDQVHLKVAPKGFGSENMSRLYMLNPTAGAEGVVNAIVETVKLAGGKPCPPLVVGVGVGGTVEKAALLAKRSLFRPVGSPSDDDRLAKLEKTALARINNLGIGAQGVGGITTALAVHIESFPTHIAGLPVVINIQCHAARHAEAVI